MRARARGNVTIMEDGTKEEPEDEPGSDSSDKK